MTPHKKRLSYLDYVIIASLVFFAIGLFSRYTHSKASLKDSSVHEADVVFEMHSVGSDIIYSLYSDTTLYNERGERFGVLLTDTVSVNGAKIRQTTPNGSIIELPSRLLYDIEAVASVKGKKTDGGFFLNGNVYIAPNMVLTVKSSCGVFQIYITNIDVF